tara:strand:- start:472 stop:696 length:225 start_codon:yes stop_codon:yes gene_type:complete
MKVVRAVMPNGMPFIVQTIVRPEDNCIYPEDIKMYPLLVNEDENSTIVLEELPFPDIKQKRKLAIWLCSKLNQK